MRRRWMRLSHGDRAALGVATAFLTDRLQERETIEWALRLQRSDTVKREAVLHLLDMPVGMELSEPWRTAWRLIEESWLDSVNDDQVSGEYDARRRVLSGERTGSLVKFIAELVASRLKVNAFAERPFRLKRLPRRP